MGDLTSNGPLPQLAPDRLPQIGGQVTTRADFTGKALVSKSHDGEQLGFVVDRIGVLGEALQQVQLSALAQIRMADHGDPHKFVVGLEQWRHDLVEQAIVLLAKLVQRVLPVRNRLGV